MSYHNAFKAGEPGCNSAAKLQVPGATWDAQGHLWDPWRLGKAQGSLTGTIHGCWVLAAHMKARVSCPQEDQTLLVETSRPQQSKFPCGNTRLIINKTLLSWKAENWF